MKKQPTIAHGFGTYTIVCFFHENKYVTLFYIYFCKMKYWVYTCSCVFLTKPVYTNIMEIYVIF